MSDYRRYVGRTVLVQMDEQEIIGTLDRETPSVLVLTSAGVVTNGREPLPMNGDVVIDRLRILWVQVP